ncbi:MAG: hypothetical protein JOZ57_01255, partial [Abitibacteriaceae bacterium]|nr:hypothetical protein [Abditibacteriaceae bacterium]
MLGTKWLPMILLLLFTGGKVMITPARAATFTVTTTADDNDPGNADGTTSLREAILQANADPNPAVDTINFAIPGSGRQTINLTAELPEITHSVFINGYSQAGASQNTLATGDNAVLMVELNGSNVGTNTVSDPGGLVVNAPNCTIKGLVINRFPDSGIVLRTSGNLIAGNFIGTDGTGTVVDTDNDITNGNSFGNAWGVEILAANNVVGGTTPAVRNIISGNNYGGLTIYADVAGGVVTGNLVQGNYIGTDVTGTLDRGNAGEGVNIDGDGANVSGNVIGGTTVAARNVIAGNQYNGVRIIFDGATNNSVQGNIIGADVSGTNALGNSSDGVFISSAGNNLVGGTVSGAGNIIAFNGVDGVSVVAPQNNDGTLVSLPGNTISSNSIFANGSGTLSLGIDLDDDGVTPNDVGDADIGANDHQNFPVLTSATTNGFITGTLNSTPNNTFRIEFFANTAADAAGYGEGEVFLGAQNVATDGAGNASFSTTVTLPTGKPYISATATKLATGDTSEFSACVQLVAPTNKPPVNSVPGAQSVSQDTALVFSNSSNNLISISDPDAGQNAVRVTLSATNGTLTLSGTTGLTIISGSNGSSTLTFTGTISNINTALNGLSFVPAAGFKGAASLSITTNDLGNSGTGGPQVATATVPITVNALTRTFSVSNVTVPEGDSGTTNALFTITLSAASTQPLTVQFATSDGTAKAGSDYQSTNVTVGFSPGTTTRTIAVPIIGDTLNEGNETFTVLLSNPSGGAVISNGSGTGLIVDDDPLPTLSINDVQVAEGNSGITNATFTVSLSVASGRTVTVNYATADGTALSGSDYTATAGTLTIAAGQKSATITVPILGDTAVEADETFTVNLTNVSNATIARNAGVGTILNDDTTGPPPTPIPTPVPTPVPTPTPTPMLAVTLTTPANGAFINGLTTVVGTVGGGTNLSVNVSVKRLSDARYWSGH